VFSNYGAAERFPLALSWRSLRDSKIMRVILLKAAESGIQSYFSTAAGGENKFCRLTGPACPFGGSRAWFQCACGSRVGVRFDAGGGSIAEVASAYGTKAKW
jgi:hypothetical protein